MKSNIESIEVYLHSNPEERCYNKCYIVGELVKGMKKDLDKKNIDVFVEEDDSFEGEVFKFEKGLPVVRIFRKGSIKPSLYSGFEQIYDFLSNLPKSKYMLN